MIISEIAFFKTGEEANAYAGVEPEPEASETKAPATEAPVETNVPEASETDTPAPSGCGSVIGCGAVAVLVAGVTLVVLKKKD